MTPTRPLAAATRLAHAGGAVGTSGAVVPGIEPATTFARKEDYDLVDAELSYQRDNAVNWRQVEQLLAALEGAFDSRLFASGLAASTVLFQCLSPGDRVAVPDIMYHGLRHWLTDFGARWGVGISTWRAGDLDALAQAAEGAALVWVETPANPTWEITDIAAAADIAHRAGALCVVDATVSTPLLTRPLAMGADFVVHSATKYLNGHSDVLGGVVSAAADGDTWRRLAALRTGGGAVPGPFEAWLLLRGLRTLHVRLERCCANAMALAEHFEGHPAIETVRYPGLASHPGHAVAARQMHGGFGGMMSLLVRGDAAAARRVAGATRVFRPATSLGGVESLIEHRATVEGPDSPIPGNLLRLSVGIEAIDDLVADLETALADIR